MIDWKEQVVLVTGGTGSFGKKFVETMLRDYQPKKLIIFSRDELKQHEMRVGGLDHPSLRYFIGDVRDAERLRRALHGVDVVIGAGDFGNLRRGVSACIEVLKAIHCPAILVPGNNESVEELREACRVWPEARVREACLTFGEHANLAVHYLLVPPD